MFEEELNILKADLNRLQERITDSLKISNSRLSRIVRLKIMDMEIIIKKIDKLLHQTIKILGYPDFSKDKSDVERITETLTHVAERFVYIDIKPERLWAITPTNKPELMDWLKGPEIDLIIQIDKMAEKLERILKHHSRSPEKSKVIKMMESVQEIRIELRRILREIEAEFKAVRAA